MLDTRKKMAKINTRTTQVYARRGRGREGGREEEGGKCLEGAVLSHTALLERGEGGRDAGRGIQDSRGKIEGKGDEAEMEVGGGRKDAAAGALYPEAG